MNEGVERERDKRSVMCDQRLHCVTCDVNCDVRIVIKVCIVNCDVNCDL